MQRLALSPDSFRALAHDLTNFAADYLMQQSVEQDVDLEAYDAVSEARLWSTRFENDLPGIVPADGDRLLYVVDRESLTGLAEEAATESS
jgi:hypothetical protein